MKKWLEMKQGTRPLRPSDSPDVAAGHPSSAARLVNREPTPVQARSAGRYVLTPSFLFSPYWSVESRLKHEVAGPVTSYGVYVEAMIQADEFRSSPAL